MQRLYIDNKLDGGQRNYSRHLMEAGQFYSHENNKPAIFQFQLQDIGDPNFIVPTRGSYVVFEDGRFESRDEGVPDGVLFTGYISDDPEPILLGSNSGRLVTAYKMAATGEDYLPQLKQLPAKIYVNKTRGHIIRDVVESMFRKAEIQPIDVSGVREGGVERLYQIDPNKKFSDMLSEFAKTDAFRYRILHGKLFYEPEVELLPGGTDPRTKIYIDPEDPRFTPDNVSLERIATSIVNDVTVFGLEEPTTFVHEQYVSDGYQGEHRLAFKPYGVVEKILISDDFTQPSFDTSLWQEEDDPLAFTGHGDGSYLQMFDGAFNVVGGAGTPEAPEVWLRCRRGIELTGIIEFRDGEIYFPPTLSGQGIIGGLFSDESMALSACVSGWSVDLENQRIAPIINGVIQDASQPVNNHLNEGVFEGEPEVPMATSGVPVVLDVTQGYGGNMDEGIYPNFGWGPVGTGTTSLTLTEAAGGVYGAGDTLYARVAAVVGGVLTDPYPLLGDSITMTGSDKKLQLSTTAVVGATAYRWYVQDKPFGHTTQPGSFGCQAETTGTSIELTDGGNANIGPWPPPDTNWQPGDPGSPRYVTVLARTADGLTPRQGIAGFLQHGPWPVRVAWEAVAGAIEYWIIAQFGDSLFGMWIVDGAETHRDIGTSTPYDSNVTTRQQQIIVNNVTPAPPGGLTMLPEYHYILRRRFEFDIPVGLPTVRRGPRGTDVVFGEDVERVNGCTVTYSLERIDITNPEDVQTARVDIYSARIENVPEFVLYAPVVSWSLRIVMNYVKVKRPQQVSVRVNGHIIQVGDFIDGGLCAVTVQDEKSSLAWYSIPSSQEDKDTLIYQPTTDPAAFWKLGESGSHIIDHATGAYPMYTVGTSSLAPAAPTQTTDQAREFFGDGYLRGPVSGGPGTLFGNNWPVPFAVTGWFKTTSANGGILTHLSDAYGYVSVAIQNGRLAFKLSRPEGPLAGSRVVNDGQWHHFAAVHAGPLHEFGPTRIYIDGALEGEASMRLDGPNSTFDWAIAYDRARWDSLGSIYLESYFTGALDEILVWPFALNTAQVVSLFQAQQTGNAIPTPVYNPQTGVTIPPRGSLVDIKYYRAAMARARVRSTESIMHERAKFGDDGIRQHIVMPGDVTPSPRTSEECQFLAQAFLADRAMPRYEGTYHLETGERDITRLDILPAPGDMIPCTIPLSDREKIDTTLHCTAVSCEFIGKGAYRLALTVGPKLRFEEAQRKLLLARKSSIDNPEIKDDDTMVAEVLNSVGYSVPNDPTMVAVISVTPEAFTVNMNTPNPLSGGYGTGEANSDLPEGVVGYEVRRDDSGWGQGNYVARVSTATFTLTRGKRDRAFFVRPFNEQGVYSRNSALVRVISPLSNNIEVTGLDGDISADATRLYIPIDRNPDIGGWLVQKGSTEGAIVYHGNGIDHMALVSGSIVLIESGRLMISFPLSNGVYTVAVRVYNLLGEIGPPATFTITRPAPEI
jgi:hypothetical protein